MAKPAIRTARESSIMRFFPPPTFLTMPAAGIDVSDKSIKFLEFVPHRRKRELAGFGDIALKEGTVVDGDIKDIEMLAETLKELARRINSSFVRVSLPEQKAYFFTTTVKAGASHDQIIQQLEFSLEEHVPLAPSEAIVDYDRVPSGRGSTDTDGNIRVGVTVYPRSTVEAYTDAFMHAGLFPLSFEIEAQAIERAVIKHGDLETYLVVDFGETGTGISIVSRGMLAFTSTLDIAGSDLTKIFMEELSLAREDVANAKNTIGLTASEEHPALTKRLLEAVDKLGDEIRRHKEYWEIHGQEEDEKNDPVGGVVLCGGNANVKGLPGYLKRILGVPVERANVWSNVFSLDETVPEMPYEMSLSYSTAIGLALRDEN